MTISSFLILACLASAAVFCAFEIATRPPLVEADEDDMREFIGSRRPPKTESYYEVLNRLAESKESMN